MCTIGIPGRGIFQFAVVWSLVLLPALLAVLWMPQIDYLPPVKRAAVDAVFNFPPGMSPERVNREIAPALLECMRPYLDGKEKIR